MSAGECGRAQRSVGRPAIGVHEPADDARARLLVVPDSGHELMVRRPGLFNEAVSSFYRSTEQVARRRAMATEGGAA
jgi:pimeloyl-ACP methyl ester carboxylesterase